MPCSKLSLVVTARTNEGDHWNSNEQAPILHLDQYNALGRGLTCKCRIRCQASFAFPSQGCNAQVQSQMGIPCLSRFPLAFSVDFIIRTRRYFLCALILSPQADDTLDLCQLCLAEVTLKEETQKWKLTISNVQTLLIHTLSFPSTPSTLSSSTPSHQHLRAGFLQNKSSFCAIPIALLFANSLPLISVRNRARARLQMTALLGSPARWPQRSSL